MTSSAASDTLNARYVASGAPLITARPPPSGMWTSRSTTSGSVSPMPATASVTVPASPTTSTLADNSARTPERKTE